MSGSGGAAVDRGILLVIDTATTQAVAALGTTDGVPTGVATWVAGYRHSETLLPAIERLLEDGSVDRSRIAAIIVGTGPGAFTGLRVGIATAKGLSYGLGLPIVGISSGDALLAAVARTAAVPIDRVVLLLPAGPNDRTVVRHDAPPVVLRAGDDPMVGADERLAAIDLEGRAPGDAVALGEAARGDLAAELLRLGAARLAAGDPDDLAGLVPAYVTAPRGAAPGHGDVTWSRDPR